MFTFMPELGKPKKADHVINRLNAEVAEQMFEHAGHNSFNMKRHRVYPWQVDPNLQAPVANYESLEYGEIF
jgi:hypothetical protein